MKALALLAAVSLAACKSKDPPLATEGAPVAEGPGFAIQVPKGYEIVTDERFEKVRSGGGVALAATASVDDFLSSLVVIPTALAGADPSSAAFCDQLAQGVPVAKPDVEVLRHQTVELAFGSTCQYEIASKDKPKQGAIGTVVYHAERAWVLTCNLALRDERAREACEQVLRTWKFRD